MYMAATGGAPATQRHLAHSGAAHMERAWPRRPARQLVQRVDENDERLLFGRELRGNRHDERSTCAVTTQQRGS